MQTNQSGYNFGKVHFMVQEGVRSFLGHKGFHRHVIKDLSKIPEPLTLLLAKDIRFIFPNKCLEAFHRIKETPIIQSPDWSLPFEIMCDASNHVATVVLRQRRDKKPYIIYYASKTLDEA